MSPLTILVCLVLAVTYVAAQDAAKTCVSNAIKQVQVDIATANKEGLADKFEKLTNEINKLCDTDAQFAKCQQNKLTEEKKNYEWLVEFYETAKARLVYCWKEDNELECTDAVYETLKPMMEQQKVGQNVKDAVKEYQADCQAQTKKTHPKNQKPKFSNCMCNFRHFADNRIVMQKAVPFIDQLMTEVAKC